MDETNNENHALSLGSCFSNYEIGQTKSPLVCENTIPPPKENNSLRLLLTDSLNTSMMYRGVYYTLTTIKASRSYDGPQNQFKENPQIE